jgi:hypothetical protein
LQAGEIQVLAGLPEIMGILHRQPAFGGTAQAA